MLPALLTGTISRSAGLGLSIVLPVLILGLTYWLGYDKAKTDMENTVLKNAQARYEQLEKDYWASKQAMTALEDRLLKVRDRTKVVKEEVKIYVTPDKDKLCGPDRNVVRLLNDARDAAVPASAAQPASEGAATSEVGYREQVVDTLDIIERYNALMLQHNALVEWIENTYGPIRPH